MNLFEKEIWTIGHSTHQPEVFLKILESFAIELLVDVRRHPGSRRLPHFNRASLEKWLPDQQVEYLHLEALGGRRRPLMDSHNTAWRLASFRGYADYMETHAFKKAADSLQELASKKRTAYMCSEAVWWSCHRSLISDYLKVRGWKVNHIMAVSKSMEHPYTKPAQVVDGELSYREDY